MVHIGENKIVFPIHQGPFHGRDGTDKNMLRLGQGAQDLPHLNEYGQGEGGLSNLVLIIPVLYLLFKVPPHS